MICELMMKKYIKLLGYLISVLFLYITFKGIDFFLLFKYFKYINFYYIAFALVLDVGFIAIRGLYQINNLYYVKPDIKFVTSNTSIAIAYFYNTILPARLGEMVRVFFLAKKEDISKTSILSYIFIEKIMDLAVILLLFSLIIVLGFKDVKLVNTLVSFLGIIGLIVFLLFIYLRFNKKILLGFFKFIPKRLHEIINKFNTNIMEGFRCFRTVEQIFKGIVLLISGWAIVIAIFFLISYPYVQLLGLPFYSCVFFMVFSTLSLTIPSAPSGIGVMDYGLFLAVKLLSNNLQPQVNLVAAFVITMHCFLIAIDLIAGGFIMIYHKIHLKTILINECYRLGENNGTRN